MYINDNITRRSDLIAEAHIFKYSDIVSPDSNLNFMIIDDNKRDIQLFEDLLSLESNLKFSLSKWTNSHDAIAALESKQISPDLIILDLVMPCMNGKMILKHLKSIPFLIETPIVIHSSMNNFENTMSVNQLGAHAFFSKPLNVELFESFVLGDDI
jgi:chemotaxis family two-component system response regulator PixH